MNLRELAGRQVPAIGLGCMNLSHAYAVPPTSREAVALLQEAYALGVRHFDTAALYGFGSNEELVGKALKPMRQQLFLASKCGMTGVNGKRVIDGRPSTLLATVEDSLRRLQTDHIDLYYLHRWDKSVPIEDSVGAMALMVEQGKVGSIGLSEVSAVTLRKANAVHPIAAVQTEYSLWTRNPEVALLSACRELDAALVAFSPLGRGFLAGAVADPAALPDTDIRRGMPRFQSPNFEPNSKSLTAFSSLAEEVGCTPAQLALSWLLAQDETVLPIPGTRSSLHLRENLAAAEISLPASVIAAADSLINAQTVSGARYPPATQLEIDTEELPF